MSDLDKREGGYDWRLDALTAGCGNVAEQRGWDLAAEFVDKELKTAEARIAELEGEPTEAMVEAAAKAVWMSKFSNPAWDELSEAMREEMREQERAALTAALSPPTEEKLPSVSYDEEVDAFYVTLRNGKQATTVEVSTDLLIDLDTDGRTLGVEVLTTKVPPTEETRQASAPLWTPMALEPTGSARLSRRTQRYVFSNPEEEMSLTKCPICKGTGDRGWPPRECQECDGTGVIVVREGPSPPTRRKR
jgi:uncharacterized protein YuzE